MWLMLHMSTQNVKHVSHVNPKRESHFTKTDNVNHVSHINQKCESCFACQLKCESCWQMKCESICETRFNLQQNLIRPNQNQHKIEPVTIHTNCALSYTGIIQVDMLCSKFIWLIRKPQNCIINICIRYAIHAQDNQEYTLWITYTEALHPAPSSNKYYSPEDYTTVLRTRTTVWTPVQHILSF